MSQFKIVRTTYQRARQNELPILAAHIAKQMQEQPAFATLSLQLHGLTAANEVFRQALALAHNGGIIERYAKDLARERLVDALNTVATAVERLAQQHPQRIQQAGFTPQQSRGTRYSEPLAAPVVLRAASTGQRGEIRLHVADAVPQAVRTHVVAVSYDRGQTWATSHYNTRRHIVLTGLHYTPELWVRVAAIGARNGMSSWSEVAVAGVI